MIGKSPPDVFSLYNILTDEMNLLYVLSNCVKSIRVKQLASKVLAFSNQGIVEINKEYSY
tara:strand:- start:4857 stop:5036 length:180 start_codon:yes stop_codon:yes gene_type:complete